MTCILRLGLVASALGLVLTGVRYAEVGLESLDFSGSRARLQREREQTKTLERDLERALRRLQAKDRLAEEVIADRMTLLEAAARVRDLHGPSEVFWQMLRLHGKGNSDEERLCWHVIGWVRSVLAQQPDRAAEVTARLEKELREHRLPASGG